MVIPYKAGCILRKVAERAPVISTVDEGWQDWSGARAEETHGRLGRARRWDGGWTGAGSAVCTEMPLGGSRKAFLLRM